MKILKNKKAEVITEQNKNQKLNLLMLVILQATVCLYTVSGIAAKLASNYEFLSLGFILCYGLEIFVLGLYAIVWQQIIKRVDISIAYANRAVAVFWTMLWSFLLFNEQITIQNLIGVAIIFVGTWVVNSSD